MVSKQQLAPVFHQIVAAHGHLSQLTPAYFSTLETDLRPYPVEYVEWAIREHRHRCKFAPTSVELLSLCEERTAMYELQAECEERDRAAPFQYDFAAAVESLRFLFHHQFGGDREAVEAVLDAYAGWWPGEFTPAERKRARRAVLAASPNPTTGGQQQ